MEELEKQKQKWLEMERDAYMARNLVLGNACGTICELIRQVQRLDYQVSELQEQLDLYRDMMIV